MISNLPPSLTTGDSVMSSRYRGKYDLKLTTISYDRRFCYEFQVQRQVWSQTYHHLLWQEKEILLWVPGTEASMISNLPPSLMTGDSVMSSRYRGKYGLRWTGTHMVSISTVN